MTLQPALRLIAAQCLNVSPDGVELLRRVAIEDVRDGRCFAVCGKFRHLGVQLVPWRIEHETLIEIVSQPVADLHEVNSGCDPSSRVDDRLMMSDPVAL